MPSLLIQLSYILLLFFMLSYSVSASADDSRAESLFQEGETLYQQRYSAVAITPLEEAAKLGHAGAAHRVGEILRRRYTYITEEAEAYYLQAAEGGEVYAMLRLAQKGNFCGTLRNCDYDRDVWVERAAENGHAFAQYCMAVMLDEQGRGFYWTQAGRRADILKWLEASAEQGFPKAMHKLASEYAQDGRMEEAVVWADRMGKTDYFPAIYEYGLVLVDGPDGVEGLIQYPETKPVEGLAMLFALYRETRRSSVQRSIDRRLPGLPPEILAVAKAKSEDLLVDKPILHYLPRFGT